MESGKKRGHHKDRSRRFQPSFLYFGHLPLHSLFASVHNKVFDIDLEYIVVLLHDSMCLRTQQNATETKS